MNDPLAAVQREAREGNPEAQRDLGQYYADGKETEHEYIEADYAEAAKWWEMAARQGNVRAQVDLAFLHSSGLLEAGSEAVAVTWWRAAAELGHPAAQYQLAMSYYETALSAGAEYQRKDEDLHPLIRGPQSLEEWRRALRWFRAAAESGDAEAQTWVGYAYRCGLGVRKNGEQAARWYRRAAFQGLAQIELAGCTRVVTASA